MNERMIADIEETLGQMCPALRVCIYKRSHRLDILGLTGGAHFLLGGPAAAIFEKESIL